MSVRITVVVMLVVEVDALGGGGCGGSATPGECIVPAKAETASARLRVTTTHVRRK
jgi:hypothetical protein